MPIADVLLITFSLLLIAMIATNLCQYIAIPYTVILVILGISINLADYFLPITQHLQQFHLTPDIVLFIFLPALIFESALSLDARALLKNLIPIIVLAIPGMLLSACLVGISLAWLLKINLVVALIFGALISATDPVAVVSLFKELGVSKRLMILVEGESLFNDATAIVLFNILLSFIVTGDMLPRDLLPALSQFFIVFVGGILIGGVIGLIMSELMVRLYQGNEGIPVILSIIMAYFSFIFAEHYFHVSGVMAVLTAAICLNTTSLIRLSHDSIQRVRHSWETLVLVCNSLLFILIGLSVDLFSLLSDWKFIFIASLAVAVARALSVYLLTPVTTLVFKLPAISLAERHIMWWGGLKGGLAIAVVLSIPDTLPEKQLLVGLTLGVVLVSLLINAPTIQPLIHGLKLDQLSPEEELELEHNTHQAKLAIDRMLHQFSKHKLLDQPLYTSLETSLASKLTTKPMELSQRQRLEQLHQQTLEAEREKLAFLHDIKLINYYTYISFMEVLTRDKENVITTEKNQPLSRFSTNFFTRLETMLMQFLGHHNSLLSGLTRYQNLRFSNRIQHDIAGILMAYKALKVINTNEFKLNKKKQSAIKKLYQSRLSQRQQRLKDLSDLYPLFYSNYEYLLFQRVTLVYALNELSLDLEASKISHKVYYALRQRLLLTLKQLPKIKTVISAKCKHQWINETPLFKGLPQAMLENLAQKTEYINFLPHDIIFNQGDKGYFLYILLNGSVDVYQKNHQGIMSHLAILQEGSFIGEHALLRHSRRSATIKARTYVTFLRLTAAEVIKLSILAPELSIRLREADLQRQLENSRKHKLTMKSA